MAKEIKKIFGYKWDTIEEFNAANALCDTHFGYPNAGADTTMSPKENRNDEGTLLFYYQACEKGFKKALEPVLGDVQKFDIYR